MSVREKIVYGDFQTPEDLANQAVSLIKESFPYPSVIVEPTCGTGNFIKAALPLFNDNTKYYGFDINGKYIDSLRKATANDNCVVELSDFFKKDWEQFFSGLEHEKILIIGNPPWVTNSALSVLNSGNIPDKSNFSESEGICRQDRKSQFRYCRMDIDKNHRKVAISGLYKSIRFSLIGSELNKAIMLDDTCYFISCHSENEAYFLEKLLNSEICQRFLKSLIFFDAKRPVTIDILKRVDLKKLAEHLREESDEFSA